MPYPKAAAEDALGNRFIPLLKLQDVLEPSYKIAQQPSASSEAETRLAEADRQADADALSNRSVQLWQQGDFQQALEILQQALAIYREIGDRRGEGRSVTGLGAIASSVGQYEQALDYFQQALTISQEIGDRTGEGTTLNNIGLVYRKLGQYEQALISYEQALAIRTKIGDRAGEGAALNNIGAVYYNLGQYERALDYYEQALAISTEIGDRSGEGTTLNNIGATYLLTDRSAEAEQNLYEAIEVLESLRAEDLDDADKIALFETQTYSYQFLQQVLIAQEKHAAALEVAERGRARATVELLAEQVSERLTQEIITDAPNLVEIQRIAQQQNITLVNYSILDNSVSDPALYIWVVQPDGTVDFIQQPLEGTDTDTPIRNPIAQLDGAFYRGATQPDASSPIVAELRSALGTDRGIDLIWDEDAIPTNRLQTLHQLLIDPIAHLLPPTPTRKSPSSPRVPSSSFPSPPSRTTTEHT